MRIISSAFYYLITFWFYKLIFGSLGKKTRIFKLLRLEYPENIYLGERVTIFGSTWLAANPLTNMSDCRLIIGNGSSIGHFNHIYATHQVVIGENVLTASKVYIADNSHTYIDIMQPVISQPVKQLDAVYIGDGAWLGENVCVIGASVGKGSVIGANSVVLTSIPDYCVAVGTPARIIKRFSFDKNKWLQTDAEGKFIDK